MIAKSVFDYLEPYLPYQMAYAISMAAFFFERFIMPKASQLYSNASLDPKSLVPFIISAIALYLSIVSIYYAFRAALRMVWFLIKWSLVIVSVWLVLAIVNDFRDRSQGGSKLGTDLIQDYAKTFKNLWKRASSDTANLGEQLGFDPIQMILGHGFFTTSQSFFNSFQTKGHQSSSSFNSQKKFSSQNNDKNTYGQAKSKTRSSSDQTFNLPQLINQIWVQSVQAPIQTIIKQSQSKSKSQSRSGTHNR